MSYLFAAYIFLFIQIDHVFPWSTLLSSIKTDAIRWSKLKQSLEIFYNVISITYLIIRSLVCSVIDHRLHRSLVRKQKWYIVLPQGECVNDVPTSFWRHV